MPKRNLPQLPKKSPIPKQQSTFSGFKTELEFKPMEGFGGGFRSEWISAKYNNAEFGIDSGAGLGNPLITFWIAKKDQAREYYTADVSELLRGLIGKATA